MSEHTSHGPAPDTLGRPDDAEGPDLKYYLSVLRRRIWIVATAFIVVVTLGAVQAFKATPIYEASADILIEKQGPHVMEFSDVRELQVADRDYYSTQEQLVKSRTVLERAVAQPGMAELLESKATEDGRKGLFAFIGEVRSTLSAVLGATPPAPPEPWEELRKLVDVEQLPDTHLIRVTVRSPNPRRAATVANAVAGAFEQYHLARKLESSNEAFAFLEVQKAEQEKKLLEAEDRLQRYREQANSPSLAVEERSNPLLARLSRLSDRLTEVELLRIELQARATIVEDGLGLNGEQMDPENARLFALPEVREDQTISQLRSDLLVAREEASGLAGIYGPEHPRVASARAREKLLQQELRGALQNTVQAISNKLAMLRRQEETLKDQYDAQNQKALALARQSLTYRRLSNDVERNRKLFDVLVERMREVDLTADYAKTNVEVVERADIPKAPVSPHRARIVLFSIFLALLLGGGLAFLFEYLDDTVRTPEDMEEHVGVPVLGFVPSMDNRGGRDSFVHHGMVTALEPMSSVGEAYRSIRTSLFFASPEADTRAVVVTSGGPGDGKTTTATNLAIVIAQSGKRVLMLDADLRRPMVHEALGLSNEEGLSNVLVGNAELQDVVQRPRVEGERIEGLEVVTSGPIPPNPAELLDSPRMARLIETAREQYDRILLDTPPVLFVTDASILAAMCDGTIMVVKAASNTRSLARRAREQLEYVNARVLGGVLNDVHLSRLGYYHSDYYQYGYSGYYTDYYGTYYSQEEDEA